MTLPDFPGLSLQTSAPQVEGNSVEDRLARIESKIDSIGQGTNWVMRKIEQAEHMMSAMAQNPMIRQMLPKGMSRG